MDLFESTNKVHCGEIFLVMDFTTYQKVFEINCILCGTEFKGFEDYEIHIQEKHFIKQELENESCMDLANEAPYLSTDEHYGDIFNNELEQSDDVQLSNNVLEEDEIDTPVLKCSINEGVTKKTYSQIKTTTTKSEPKNHKLKKLQASTINIPKLKKSLSETKEKLAKSMSKPEIQSKRNFDNKSFTCTLCNKSFINNKLLLSHMRYEHRDHKPYKCNFCSKGFFSMNELRIHTRFHTGERPHLCPTCGDRFSTTSLLKIHDKRHHTFIRDKECPICKKAFMDGSTLKCHMTIHYEDRPYHCNICQAKFKRRFYLTAHMKSHENKREHKCDLCSSSFNLKCNLTSHKKKTHSLVTKEN